MSDEKTLIEFCALYGSCSARVAYIESRDPVLYEQSITKLCRRLNLDTMLTLIDDAVALAFHDSVPHKLISIIPDKEDHHRSFNVAFVSDHLYRLLTEHVKTCEVEACLKLYRLFLAIGSTRVMAGSMLKDCMHILLPKGGMWELIELDDSKPCKRHLKTPANPGASAWLHRNSKGISVKYDKSTEHSGSLPFFRPEAKEWKSQALEFGYYALPHEHTSIDALFYDPEQKRAWVFQATVSATCTLKSSKSIVDLLGRGVEKITLILVTPPQVKIDVSFPDEDEGWKKLTGVKYHLPLTL
ncbi:MAG TPA: hypothetical protein VGO47_14225 [Chlamydiales bacterium]|nr:hypothetical protein [Chlamydiales bacterium]